MSVLEGEIFFNIFEMPLEFLDFSTYEYLSFTFYHLLILAPGYGQWTGLFMILCFDFGVSNLNFLNRSSKCASSTKEQMNICDNLYFSK